jgi:hypothetical protein
MILGQQQKIFTRKIADFIIFTYYVQHAKRVVLEKISGLNINNGVM